MCLQNSDRVRNQENRGLLARILKRLSGYQGEKPSVNTSRGPTSCPHPLPAVHPPYPEPTVPLLDNSPGCSEFPPHIHTLTPCPRACPSGLLSQAIGLDPTPRTDGAPRPENGLGMAVYVRCGQSMDTRTGVSTRVCTGLVSEGPEWRWEESGLGSGRGPTLPAGPRPGIRR